MLNETIIIKIKNRLNKLDSQDFSNIPPWQILEAFNKAQLEWARRNLHGSNIYHEGDSSSTSRLDDLQKLMTVTPALTFTDAGTYFESNVSQWPDQYLRYERLDVTVKKDCCDVARRMQVYLGEEANVDIYLNDPNVKPGYAWGETFGVIRGNKIIIYHDDEFILDVVKLVYYRRPVRVTMTGVMDAYLGSNSTTNTLCEFNDDLVEVIIDDAGAILAGDIENPVQVQRLGQDAEKNN